MSRGTGKRTISRPFLWVLAVLFGLLMVLMLLPAIGTHEPAPRRWLARSECAALETAVRSYRQEYRLFPLQHESGPDHKYESDYRTLISALQGGPDTNENPRGVWFLEFTRTQKPDEIGRDPWGAPYHVVADWDGNGAVTVGTNGIPREVAVWSSGKNGRDEQGAGDDICSWDR